MRIKNTPLGTGILILFFLASCFIANAQKTMNDYQSEWKKVEAFQKKGLPQSALAEVEKIYNDASKNNNSPQIIKSILFKTSLQFNQQENASEKNIRQIESETKKAKEPAKSILQNIAAQLYWNYFQQNRYRIYQRTNTENFKKEDIASWTTSDFHSKISQLYLASINNKNLLQKSKLDPFDAIILKGNVRYLRPTLFDLLTHRALDYFNNDERDIVKASYSFEIDNNKVFAPANEFLKEKFVSKDSFSLHYKALLIYQDLLAFHIGDENKEGLIEVDLARLEFANRYGVMPGKTELYINALKNIYSKNKNNPAAAQVAYLVAQVIYSEANEANESKKLSSVYSIKKAKDVLEEVIKSYPKSEGGINAQNLLNSIVHPQLNLITEKVNVPGLPFLTLVKYKNSNQVWFRILPLTKELKNMMRENDGSQKVFAKLVSGNSIRNWQQALPKTDDYLEHSVEVKIDALPVGEYVLLGSGDANFSLDKTPIVAQYFYISDISFINSREEYFILNRTTGKPLANAKAQLWFQKYSYDTRENTMQKGPLLVANKNGYLRLPNNEESKDHQFVKLELSYLKDYLFLDDFQYTPYYEPQSRAEDAYENQKEYDEESAKVFLFTDRSIYRPGQIVYFKAIGVTKDIKNEKSILLQSKDSLTVTLTDANGQKTDSINVKLNEFGSFNGKFKIPENKLNGEFNIEVSKYNNSSISFSVEEYKRPKFYTEFEKVKESYRVGDTVSITGFAKAYAGNNIDGALVKFSVTREARFLYPWMFWRKGFPRTSSLEITHGEITTDANGKFSIKFAAIPDLTLDKSTDPVFDYKIVADVTDINGETRSGDITIPVGYKALNLQISLLANAVFEKDSLKNIPVSSTNLSDEPVAVKANLKIYKLESPDRLIRKRFWNEPDQFIYSKEEYIRNFPHDEYKDESQKESWAKGEMVFEKTDSVSKKSSFDIQPSTFSEGWYVAEVEAKDQYGKEVKDKKYFQVFDKKSATLPAQQYIWNYAEATFVEPGEKAKFINGSSASDLFVIEQIDRKGLRDGITPANTFNYISLNKNKKAFEFLVTEEDRGGFSVNHFFVKDNRFYVSSNLIFVPWSNKELTISFDTYRDKTLPGSEEKWKVSIKGNKGDKVAAEMLVSMYDASLDQFQQHSWESLNSIWPTYYSATNWIDRQNFTTVNSIEKYSNETYIQQKERRYDALNYLPGYYTGFRDKNIVMRGDIMVSQEMAAPGMMKKENLSEAEVVTALSGKVAGVQITDSALGLFPNDQKPSKKVDQSQIQIRKNFNETAFFFPELRTDKDGNIEFSFTMPEALTQWKLMTLAHTKDLASGYAERTVITQKELMVQPNTPRFLREGDQVEFTAKVVNMGDKEVTGQAELQLLNASTMSPVDGWFKNIIPVQYFTAAAGQSTLVNFSIDIPTNFNNAVVYRIVAKAGNVSDGEEAPIPVVTNRMLVTESMPLNMKGDGSKNFSFEKLIHSNNSKTLTNYGLTVEYTTNPVWTVVQSLPYLMEYPYDCSEQNFNRFYANALAQKIVSSSPKIKMVFDKWKTTDTAALMSNLQKNEELKTVLLQETPWVLNAQNEQEQKKNIALLFDMVKMSEQMASTLDKLSDMQSSNGGFVWFKGGQDNRYITQYIVTGIGHLKKLNAYPMAQQAHLKSILNKAIPYLDKRIKEDYNQLIKNKANLKNNQLSAIAIQYLYMRSFFPDYTVEKSTNIAYSYYREQAKKYWLSQGIYLQGMIALALNRADDKKAAKAIVESLQQNSINNEELGRYWKEWDRGGYWWYQAPIESQALMIEVFSEISKDEIIVDELKTWLLKNKQTNSWESTKATAEAVYAILLQGSDWQPAERNVSIQLGNTILKSQDQKLEAGSGYFKTRIDGDKVKPEMGNIKVTTSSANLPSNKTTNVQSSWGAAYWQYFENLDKISFAETPLRLSKKLFIERNTDRGPVLTPVNDRDQLHIGDKIKVRIELRADRDMEYVHMKDMRASCMEPTNVISQYKYQDGLGYYETTKDVSTNFFFSYLRKGTYIFEYPMFVTHAGNFSNGITSIQCMYAPEFTAHSEGVRVNVLANP